MVVIVEGKHDYEKLKSVFPDLYILMSNGTSVSAEFLSYVKKLSETNEILLCLDPDHPGEKIRHKIMEVVPNALHVYANKHDAISKNRRKVGIEHMSKEDIMELFNNVKRVNPQKKISNLELYNLGLIGNSNSRKLREKLCNDLHIGYANAKQLAVRLAMFNITIDEVKENL